MKMSNCQTPRRRIQVSLHEPPFFSSRFMKSSVRLFRITALTRILAGLLCAASHMTAALVGPAGYTNSFDTLPLAADWATAARAGAVNDVYDMDADVNTNGLITTSLVTNRLTASANNPPGLLPTAQWSSTGLYIQTRPSGGRYTVIMGKFVNDTRSNATEIAISYTRTFAGNPALEDTNKGTRVYYSLTGASNSWINLEAFNTTATNGSLNLSTNLAVDWPYGTNLFVLWVDDNALPATDVANQMDNFSLRLTAGFAPTVFARLDGPTHNAVLFADVPTTAAVFVTNGTPPYLVRFWTNSGPGNPTFQLAGSTTPPPFSFNVGAFSPGTYNLYATATDENGAGSTFTTATNTFSIVNARVTLNNPTNGQNAIFGQPFTLAAAVAVDAAVTVSSVEFFYNGASFFVDTAAPYSATIADPVLGSHTVFVVVRDSLGRVTYSRTNQVTFTVDFLANNNFDNRSTLGTPASVTGNNTGANNEGGEPTFQFGGGQPTIIWGATLWWKWTAPFDGTVTIDTFGSTINTVLCIYSGTAVNALTLVRRNDNASGSTTASLVSFAAIAGTEYQIQVGGQGGFGSPPAQGAFQLNLAMPPYVAITNPPAGSTYLVGDILPVEVTAASGAGAVTNVSLYNGATLIGSVTNAPYSFVISNAPAGSNSFYAVALDSIGQVGTSAVVRVLVANVGLTIVSPQDGALVASTNPIPVSVFGIVPGGTITRVDFFVDGQLFGQSTASPFSAVWSNVTGGSHRLTATGLDNLGNFYAAAAVNFAVGQVLVRSNAVWKYLDTGTDQSNAWIAVDFDDSNWASGPAELGYGDGDEATLVASGPANAFYITTYFRRSLVVTNIAALTNLILSLEYDDAAAVYLNGREMYRVNLPAGATYTTAAGAPIEDTLSVITLSATNLIEGTNLLAVEIHQQSPTSSDISFNLDLVGVPIVIRNISPLAALTNLVNNQSFIAPPAVTIEATASDEDGSVSKVEFYDNGVKIGEDSDVPYRFVWNNPPVGDHTLMAVATDNQNARGGSTPVLIVVYDAAGTPVVRITSPADGAVLEGPTNLLFTASAHAISGVTNVQFIANGSVFGNDPVTPYAAVWPSIFLSNNFVAVVFAANGARATSAPVNLTVTIPPTNTVPPMVATQLPPALAMITNLTNITIVFSERVQGVDAADLLINGRPATGLTGSGSNYTFSFPHPPYGIVEVAFATEHGITDFGYPLDLALNEFAPSSLWQYDLFDRTPPRVASHGPATGATVTNLTVIAVSFSEDVTGVDASDLLVNGTPAYNLTGNGSNYSFNVFQPASGTVNITWSTNHGIADLAVAPNAFVRNAAGNPWNFTLDARTVLVQSNSVWKYVKGLSEASSPTNAWRQPGYNDAGWINGSAPFVFGEPNFTNALNPGTDLGDMTNNAYSSIYLRQQFVVKTLHGVTNVLLNRQSDDGFIAWLNGVQIYRFNMPTGEIAYNGSALTGAAESGGNSGAPYVVVSLTNAVPLLVEGTNVLAVHAFNFVTNPPSSDFVFNAQLYTFITDLTVVPPRLVLSDPPPGDVYALTNITVTFSEEVTNVSAADLLINGVPASALASTTNTTYTFRFAQPSYGSVTASWVTNHGIVDFDSPPKPFDATVANATLRYTLVNSNAPLVLAQTPEAGSSVTGLTSITITFNEPVTGVDAGDLLLNGSPLQNISGSGSNYTFTFAQPVYGIVTVRWATNHGIRDLEVPANDFEPGRPGNQWNYSLINPVPTVVMASPTNNAFMLSPADVPLRATATDNDGTIARVEYFEAFEDYKIGEATNAPYTVIWSNRTVGFYGVFAIATDNSGLTATSAPVVINVVTSLPVLLVRGPYLQSGSPTGAVVRWRTDQISDAIVRWGSSPLNLTNLAVQTIVTNEHTVQVGGLQPGTKYFYSIASSSRLLAGGTNVGGSNFWFHSHPVAGVPAPTRFWVLGDPGTANANQRAVRDSYSNYVASGGRPADLWMMLGDNAYNSGTDTEYQAAVFDMYPETLRNYFLWPVLGNHETSQSTSTTINYPYLDIFSTPRNGEAGGVPSGNPKYYSFDYANVHFVALDSMTSGRATNSPMVLWLQDDLAATTQDWTIVYFHHSLYTKGTHDSDSEADLVQMRQNFNPILEANGVDLVLMGHSHVYERSYLLDGHYGLSSTLTPSMKIDGGDGRLDGTGAYRKSGEGRGVVYSIVGNSGQALGGPLNHPAHFISINLLGSLLVDVQSNRLDATFLTSTGTTNDHYTLFKRGPAPGTPLNLAAQFVSTNQIQITWVDVATDELGYIIERSSDCVNFFRLATNAPNTTQFLDFGLPANTSYCYRLRAFNGENESVASNVANGSTAVPRALLTARINALTGARSLSLSGLTGTVYMIERKTNLSDSTTWQPWMPVTLSNSSQTIDLGITNVPTLFYRARQ